MLSPLESREALKLLTSEAVATSLELVTRSEGSFEERRLQMLDGVPAVVDYFAEGAAALAADFYEDQRELAGVVSSFTAEAVVLDRTEKLRSAVAWSAAPLAADDLADVLARLDGVVQLDVARAFRDTITTNRRNDPGSVGWRRITAGGCKLCRMLADRGAVYRHDTALFAAHPNCNCTAQPVFKTDVGEEASVMQYVASRRNRTAKQRQMLREYLDSFY